MESEALALWNEFCRVVTEMITANDPSTIGILDNICQGVITLIAPTALLLKTWKLWWAPIVGISQQPFWFISAILHSQLGFFVTSCIFTVLWSYSLYSWTLRPWWEGHLGTVPGEKRTCPHCSQSLI